MILRRRGADVLVRAPAKVNLFLEVLRRRADGYHELATLMTAVSLYDTLRFRDNPAGSVSLRCDRADLSAGPDNLICRAAELLRRRAGRDLGVDAFLWKRIPTAAGLGGGSSDAAAALAGLNVLWCLGLGRDELTALAAELGSDVPFFFGLRRRPGVPAAANGSNRSSWADRSISCWYLRRSACPRRRCLGISSPRRNPCPAMKYAGPPGPAT